MNEPSPGASHPVMTSLGRLELLLTRAHDGVADADELAELAAAGLGRELEELAALRAALVAACRVEVDVAGDVLAGIEPPAWGDELRAAVRVDVDVADGVMADLDGLEVSRFADGEVPAPERAAVAARLLRDPDARAVIAAHAEVGSAVREAVRGGGEVDVWNVVATAIGADPDYLEGWGEVAAELRQAVTLRVDVAGDVMARIAPRARVLPRWASLGIPGGVLAAAAAVLFFVVRSVPTDDGVLQLASVNDAQIEDIQTEADVVANVVQFEDGGPTFIMIDDPDGAHDGASL